MDPVVEIKQGKLKGKTATSFSGSRYYSFKGIPYAQPPIGELRFKAPLAPNPWEGTRDASKEGNVSFSRSEATGKIVGSEDCLYLNVYTPKINNGQNYADLPVIFWIHGGLYLYGSGDSDFYGPDFLMTENIILVTFNYRLGILGFLKFDDPKLGVHGNAALKDTVMALKWIQENIQKFCGDCNNVTIAGHSAGAASVHYLMLSPMAKGLFHRAILQGGSALNPWALGICETKKIAETLNCRSDNEEEMLKFLLSVSAKDIFATQEKLSKAAYIHKVRLICPVIENCTTDAFLSDHPLNIIKSGNYNKVPIIIGYASKEGLISEIMYGNPHSDFATFNDFRRKIPHYFNIPEDSGISEQVAEKIKQFYFDDDSGANNLEKFYTMQTDMLVLLGIYNTINEHIVNLGQPIYFYKMSIDAELNMVKILNDIKGTGTCHGDELGYLFKNNNLPICTSHSPEFTCINRLVKLWSNFARNGDPNPKTDDPLIKVTWKPVEPGKYNYLNIDKKLTTGINLDVERIKFWDQISSNNPYQSLF